MEPPADGCAAALAGLRPGHRRRRGLAQRAAPGARAQRRPRLPGGAAPQGRQPAGRHEAAGPDRRGLRAPGRAGRRAGLPGQRRARPEPAGRAGALRPTGRAGRQGRPGLCRLPAPAAGIRPPRRIRAQARQHAVRARPVRAGAGGHADGRAHRLADRRPLLAHLRPARPPEPARRPDARGLPPVADRRGRGGRRPVDDGRVLRCQPDRCRPAGRAGLSQGRRPDSPAAGALLLHAGGGLPPRRRAACLAHAGAARRGRALRRRAGRPRRVLPPARPVGRRHA